MAKPDLPTPADLCQLLRYEPETGMLFWMERPPVDAINKQFNAMYAGKRALTADNGHGYMRGEIFGRPLLAHRAAWALTYGEWPERHIDHVNGDRADNRITNLRLADFKTNAQNMKRFSNNTSGVVGVYRIKGSSKWTAAIWDNRRKVNLGRFDLFEQAVAARKAAERSLGFDPRHGRRD